MKATRCIGMANNKTRKIRSILVLRMKTLEMTSWKPIVTGSWIWNGLFRILSHGQRKTENLSRRQENYWWRWLTNGRCMPGMLQLTWVVFISTTRWREVRKIGISRCRKRFRRRAWSTWLKRCLLFRNGCSVLRSGRRVTRFRWAWNILLTRLHVSCSTLHSIICWRTSVCCVCLILKRL